eukprot:gene29003-38044_t
MEDLRIEELLLVFNSNENSMYLQAESLKTFRPAIATIVSLKREPLMKAEPAILWVARRNGLQIDSLPLDDIYLGKKKLSNDETVRQWNDFLTSRVELLDTTQSTTEGNGRSNHLGDGGPLQKELDSAIAIVQRASFVARSLQRVLLSEQSSTKNDCSPVTVADFCVQAMVLSNLRACFPSDRFIAEEDSQLLRTDHALCDGVLNGIRAAVGENWSQEKLYDAVDLGSYDGSSMETERVWILDPVDGTKGFMRGQHFCVALALVDRGKPRLSTMGCPNLNIYRVLQGDSYDDRNIDHVDPFILPDEGRAFVRSLSMPSGSAFEVTVSGVCTSSDARLCESYEASHGNRGITGKVFESMKLRNDFVRLDGQCKYCVIGAGAAEGNLRLPAAGYKEKTWDQAPGAHFIEEAGGRITDLSGNNLNFRQGRFLIDVTGIVASNGLLHEDILQAVASARN